MLKAIGSTGVSFHKEPLSSGIGFWFYNEVAWRVPEAATASSSVYFCNKAARTHPHLAVELSCDEPNNAFLHLGEFVKLESHKFVDVGTEPDSLAGKNFGIVCHRGFE
jgi:hypothetical protein